MGTHSCHATATKCGLFCCTERLDTTPTLPVFAGNRLSTTAGTGAVFGDTRLTADGLDLIFGGNFIGHFALTTELMPLILSSPAAPSCDHAYTSYAWLRFKELVLQGCRYRFGGEHSTVLKTT